MKKIFTPCGIWAVYLMLMFVSCSKETSTEGTIPDGALVQFSIMSDEIETRTVYGEKYTDPYDNNAKKQQILWKVGDEVTIVMYDPDNFADHQEAVYVVVDSPESMVWKPEVSRHRALVKIKDGYEPLRWNREWTKRKFVAYFVPSMQEEYITPWVSNSVLGGLSSNWGDKGYAQLPMHNNQPRFTLKGLGTSQLEAVPNMYYAHMFAEQEIQPTSLDDLDVTLVFNPLFTSFEVTLNNPLNKDIGLLGVLLIDGEQYTTGNMIISDLTNPYSYSVGNNAKYATGFYIYQFDEFYSDTVENPGHFIEYKTIKIPANGTFTLTLFCLPKTYKKLKLEVYYDIVRVQSPYGDTYASDTLPLASSSGQYFTFDAFKKHVLHIDIPETVESYFH